MLELKNIYKTFNPGTINEKVALNGLNLDRKSTRLNSSHSTSSRMPSSA